MDIKSTPPLRITGLYMLRRRLGLRKTAVGLMPFVRFFSATFGAGVNALHCPITRPKRRIQPERYVSFCLNFFEKIF
jgi:hypothetical protein